MTPKRRKLVTASKPPTDPNQLLADGLKKAIEKAGCSANSGSTGPSTAASRSQRVDEIANAIASDATIQSSYRERLRQSVKAKTDKDKDFNAERFPSSSKFVNNNQ